MDKLEPKKVGILGGTFDPPHFGHLRLAEEVKESLALDEVWFVPAGTPPHKTPFASFEHRLEMTRLATFSVPYFKTIDIERYIVPSYTVKTLSALKELNPGVEFFLILGFDAFQGLNTWWNFEKIIFYTKLVIAKREDTLKQDKEVKELATRWFGNTAKKRIIFLTNLKVLNISASEIRKLLKEKRSIKYLTPDPVEEYIKKKGLYSV